MAQSGRRPAGTVTGAIAFLVLAALAPLLPTWLLSLATLAVANGLVVVGLVVLWRAGLVSFGQALYYAIGGYTVALIARGGLTDALMLLLIGMVAAGLVAYLVGFLLARYREIFFAMLSLAISMILYGVLVKTEVLGSTDGFNVRQATFFGYAPRGRDFTLALFWLGLAVSAPAAFLVARYLRSVAGALAVPIRDNEIRVEYLGISVTKLIHLKLVLSGLLGGLGGSLAALSISHVDPSMSYWTTSGGFVFVTVLSGAGSVAAGFIGSVLFELVRTYAASLLPGAWQLILGSVLLLTILFLPEGIGSLFSPRRARKVAAP
jgi:branched-chain amino acid transport system permease protein